MKDKLIAGVEVGLFVAILVAVAPRAKSRVHPSTQPAQYASFVSFAAPAPVAAAAAAPAAAPVVSAAKAAPAAAAEPAAAAAPKAAAVAPVAAAVPAPAARAATSVPAALSAGGKQLWGVIDSVDASAHSLSVKDKHGHLHSVALTADAQVTLGGENVAQSLGDLKPGDAVTVTTENGAARLIHKRLLFPQEGAGAQASN